MIIDDNEISEADRVSIEAIRNIYVKPEEVDITPMDHEEIKTKSERKAREYGQE